MGDITRILIVDTETDGLDAAAGAEAIEVAATLYSVELQTPLESYATLIQSDAGNPCEHINRIPPAALTTARAPASAWAVVHQMAQHAALIVAHSAGFDRSFTPATVFDAWPWVCSKDDIEWPLATRPGQSLVTLVLDHGLGVAHAHRAATDVDMLVRLFQRVAGMGHDVQHMLVRAQRPKATYMACVSYDDRRLASERGFHWNPERKQWLRRLFIEDAAASDWGFTLRPVADETPGTPRAVVA